MNNQLLKSKQASDKNQSNQAKVFQNVDNTNNVYSERQKELRQQKKRLQVLI